MLSPFALNKSNITARSEDRNIFDCMSTIFQVEFRGLWFITFRMTGFCGLYPSSKSVNTRKHNVSETGSVSVFRWRKGDTSSVESLPLPQDGSRSIFRTFVFSSYLKFLTMDNVHKLSDSGFLKICDYFARFLKYAAGFQNPILNVPNH
jgi:hypothetical protein